MNESLSNIKELEKIVVKQIKSVTDKLGWISEGPSTEISDMKNKIDWWYSFEEKTFPVQFKVRSPQYQKYQDIRLSALELSTLKEHENLARFQIQVDFDTDYQDLSEKSIPLRVTIFDYKLFSKIIDSVDLIPENTSDLAFGGLDSKSLNFKRNNEGLWWVEPNTYFPFYRFKRRGDFFCIPNILMIEGQFACSIYENISSEVENE